MNKVAIVYWSGTGNTEQMAEMVATGAREAGAEVIAYTAADFSADLIDGFEAIAFGCPAMDGEKLEEDEFEPMFAACEAKLKNKKIALFGSYDWGDGEWMTGWEQRTRDYGALLTCESVIAHEKPSEEDMEACKALGESLVTS